MRKMPLLGVRLMLKTYETKSIDDVRVSAIRNLLVTGSVLGVAVLFRDIA